MDLLERQVMLCSPTHAMSWLLGVATRKPSTDPSTDAAIQDAFRSEVYNEQDTTRMMFDMLVVGPPSVYHLAMAELNPACLFVRESRNFWSLANSNWTSMNVASVSTSKICPTSRLNGHHPP